MSRARLRATYLPLRAVARLGGVTPSRIRRYEAEGLIVSDQVIVGERGERLYETSVVTLVRRIRSYEAVGVNLPGIELILRLLQRQSTRGRR